MSRREVKTPCPMCHEERQASARAAHGPVCDSHDRAGTGSASGAFLSFLRLGNGRRAQDWVALVNAFARAVEARDPYTAGHLWCVATSAELLTHETGGSRTPASDAALGGMLHDIGKVAVPDAVLLKPGPLGPEEWRIMHTPRSRSDDPDALPTAESAGTVRARPS